jgi:hypothetical protein
VRSPSIIPTAFPRTELPLRRVDCQEGFQHSGPAAELGVAVYPRRDESETRAYNGLCPAPRQTRASTACSVLASTRVKAVACDDLELAPAPDGTGSRRPPSARGCFAAQAATTGQLAAWPLSRTSGTLASSGHPARRGCCRLKAATLGRTRTCMLLGVLASPALPNAGDIPTSAFWESACPGVAIAATPSVRSGPDAWNHANPSV